MDPYKDVRTFLGNRSFGDRFDIEHSLAVHFWGLRNEDQGFFDKSDNVGPKRILLHLAEVECITHGGRVAISASCSPS